MKEKNLEELIDGFLRNKLNNADQSHLRDIIASDPEASILLKESQETYRYILHLRYKKIRKQLLDYDQHEAMQRKPNWIRRILIAASFLLLALLGSYLVASYFFDPRLVAKGNFVEIPASGLSTEIADYIIAAEMFLTQDNFQSAARLYQLTTEMIGGSYEQDAKWNFLMCNLALAGPTQEWKKEMLIFLSDTDDHFKIKGNKVLGLYNSTFYRIAAGISARKFSPIKPRLI